MNTKSIRNFLLATFASFAVVFAVGCVPGAFEEESCDPAEDEECICEDFDGDVCDDPNDFGCSCTLPFEDDEFEDDFEDEENTSNDENEGTRDEETGMSYRFVLIEDLTDPVAGEAPGSDIDAISIVRPNGAEHYATSLEDYNVGNGSFLDPTELLGAPDSNCEKQGFVSLGGAQSGGYVMVSFGTSTEDITINNGDSIKVHELGRTLCPSSSYDDDPYQVGVSVSTELGTFVEIGTGGEGRNVIPVTGL